MSVLSFSVQFAGEQSPGTKSAENTLEESTLMQVDRPRQREADKLSLANLDSKQILVETDQCQQVSNDGQLDNDIVEYNTLKELNCAPQEPVDELSNGIGGAEMPTEMPSVKPEHSLTLQGDEPLQSDHEGNVSIHEPDSSDCNISSNAQKDEANFPNEESCKEEIEQLMNIDLDIFSNPQGSGKGSFSDQEHGLELVDTLCKSRNCRLPVKDSQSDEINEGTETVDFSCSAVSIVSDASDSHGEAEDQHGTLHEQSNIACTMDFEQGNLFVQAQKNDLLSSNASHLPISNVQSEINSCSQEGESLLEGNEYLEDNTVALWVKWRGKWQTGFQCPRVDCPLPTLRAKPTHERKKYIVIFFPRTRTYSWADMLLIRSINEFPEPLASGTHRRWRKLVKDLATPRRFILQKLAVAMLNISDQLHTEAVIENARKAATWKDFAMEASCCRDYSDLGRMLLKLQTMILPSYVSIDWLENSFDSWVQRCQSAQCAESIELLTEEFVASVLWNKVNELWGAPVQPELGPEWKTWKHEAMKLFFTSHPVANGHIEQRNIDTYVEPQSSRKRLKLEVRRAESCVSQIEASECSIFSQVNRVDTDSRGYICQGFVGSTPGCEPLKVDAPSGVPAAVDSGVADDRWDEIGAKGENLKLIHGSVATFADERTDKLAMVHAPSRSDAPNKYRQCLAFIEAKGRQCGRWASDGDIYCCVHMNSHSARKLPREEQRPPADAPMCEGTTTHGNKCKHRARIGSAFCKKHRLQRSPDSINIGSLSACSGNMLKRKYVENKILENFSGSNANSHEEHGATGKVENSMQENLVPITVGETLDERNCLMKDSELYNALPTPVPVRGSSPDFPCCIGYYGQNTGEKCQENAKRHTLYCEKHLPRFLKRARNGKCRLISKDVFINLLRNCSSRKQKLYLHQACELLYGFMKNSLARQKSVLKGDNFEWILSQASKDSNIGEYLLKVVSCEREKLVRLWGFSSIEDKQGSCSGTNAIPTLEIQEKDQDHETSVKCKICAKGFSDDQTLGAHWTEVHKKEARWLFRGYACAICMNSFTNRKVLETHVKEKHGVAFLEHSILFRCMSCSSHFVNPEQLWQHVLSFHLTEFRMQDHTKQNYCPLDQPVQLQNESGNKQCHNSVATEKDVSRRYVCRFCGLKFDLLPDLGRHHQVAHMNPSLISHFPSKSGNHYVKRGRQYHTRFKKSFGAAFRIKSQNTFGMQKRFQSSSSVFSLRPRLQSQASETLALGRLLESHCSFVAETLYSEIQKTKPRPSNLEILSIARSACCKISLHAALELKYGILPENLYLKAAKLCSELNIQVGWHVEGFICSKGCKPLINPHSLAPLMPLPDVVMEPPTPPPDSTNDMNETKWEMEECHYVLSQEQFKWKPVRKATILCEDVSFGKEPVPVACVVDEDLKESLKIYSDEFPNGQAFDTPMPWQDFIYVTRRLVEPSLALDTENSQLGCSCSHSKCYPENCDHVYLFDNDYENAEDINGKPMHGRFPYDERGRIILEEGYLVYECNLLCHCDVTCHNRVLQKGVQVKLEIFRTEKKGWAVRAGEAISRGTFVCEYIGEVLNDTEANKRGNRYDSLECNYLYDIDAHINGARGLSEGTVPYVIDASKYGNVSRFINHSCSPNLVNYQVLVESMDCQLAHIGLYASRDIAAGEELAYDYRYKLVPGEGCPCHCGAPNCRGRLY